MTHLIALDLNPDRRKLQQFGFLACVIFTLLALLTWTHSGPFARVDGARAPLCISLLGVGALSCIFSLVFPPANRPLYVGILLLGYPVGVVVSFIAMAALFFGVLAPYALLRRLLGRDAMHRRYSAVLESYWLARPEPVRMDRYFRQS